MKYGRNLLLALTYLLNAVLGGSAGEDTSSRAWREREKLAWRLVLWLADRVFGAGHCQASHEKRERALTCKSCGCKIPGKE